MNITEKTLEFFETNITLLKAEILKLTKDLRKDEAVFIRIKLNVYEIFKTVFITANKLNNGNENKTKEFFLNKLKEIPENWEVSRIKAVEHGETDKVHIENLKLEAAEHIKSNFLNIWKEI